MNKELNKSLDRYYWLFGPLIITSLHTFSISAYLHHCV